MGGWKLELANLLRQEFEKARSRNPRYSMRQFAKRLNLSSGTISELLSGKRNLSPNKAIEILDQLQISKRVRNRYMAMMGLPVKIDREPPDPTSLQNHDWIDQAIAGYFELNNDDIDALWISRKTGVPTAEIEMRIKKLLAARILLESPDGRLTHPIKNVDATGLDRDMRHRFYRQSLDLAAKAMEHTSEERCFFSVYTFTGNSSQIAMFRREFKSLVDRISALTEENNSSELIQISVQAFPIDFGQS